jgi:thiol:disulfide interchange protein
VPDGIGGAVGAAAGPGRRGLALALAFGAIAARILNLMPCVFPVVGMKVLGFAGTRAATAARASRCDAARSRSPSACWRRSGCWRG